MRILNAIALIIGYCSMAITAGLALGYYLCWSRPVVREFTEKEIEDLEKLYTLEAR